MLSDLIDEGDLMDSPNSPNLLPTLHTRLNHDTAADEESTTSRPLSNQAGAVIAKIEKIFDSIAGSLLNEENSLVIPLKTRPRSKAGGESGTDGTKSGVRNITFPNKSTREAWGFSELKSLFLCNY